MQTPVTRRPVQPTGSASAFRSAIGTALVALCLSPALPGSASAFDSQGWGLLEGGDVGEYRWTVKAKREGGSGQAGPRGGRPPCIMVGVKHEHGPFSYRRVRFRTCAERPGSLRPTDGPLIATSSITGSDGRPGVTAVGTLAAPTVRRLRVTLAGGKVETVRLQPLSRGQASSTRLGRTRYAAFSVRGLWSAERVIAFSRSNRILWDSGPAETGT